LAIGTGDAYGPCSTPSAMTLYTASVGCVPYHDPYVDVSSQTLHPGRPHGTVRAVPAARLQRVRDPCVEQAAPSSINPASLWGFALWAG
jgi:hypothetical protein